MIKHIVESDMKIYADNTTAYNTKIRTEFGIFQILEWVNLEYKLPEQSGLYLVANNDFDGSSRYLHLVKDKFVTEFIDKYDIMPSLYWHETGEQLTRDECMDILFAKNIWYYMNTTYPEYGDDVEETIIIVFKDSPGQYWIDPKVLLSGPYQRDLDSLPIHITDF